MAGDAENVQTVLKRVSGWLRQQPGVRGFGVSRSSAGEECIVVLFDANIGVSEKEIQAKTSPIVVEFQESPPISLE